MAAGFSFSTAFSRRLDFVERVENALPHPFSRYLRPWLLWYLGSGLFSRQVRALVLNAPKHLITASVVFAGVILHLASETGYVNLIPLGAMIFHALGRHPIAGLAAAF